jgi:surfeit locus 1 family protein
MWLQHGIAVLIIVVCGFMGMWQLGVYDARQADQQADKKDVPSVPLTSIWSSTKPVTNLNQRRPVTFTATFRPAAEQFWVTDPAGTGQSAGGVWLVAPVVVNDASDVPLLFVRGQAAAVGALPEVPEGPVELSGVIQATQSPGQGWDSSARTIGSLRIPTLINELPYDLWPGFVVSTTASASGGLALAPRPQPEAATSWTTGGRNLGYGLQWWVFAAFVAFMWWRMGTDRVNQLRQAR